MISSPSSVPSRQVLWNVSDPVNPAVMYLLFAISLVICGFGLFQRFRLWSAGKPDGSRLTHPIQRITALWTYGIEQRSVNRAKDAGKFHSLIFYGFLVLLFTTTMVFLDHDLGIQIYRGQFYLAVTVLSDLFGLGLFYGLVLAWHRRYINRPDKLHSTASDALLLIVLGLLVIQGFLLEALRIHATGDPWRFYSPVGYVVSLVFWPLSVGAARSIHFIIWWFHTVTVFAVIAVLPYTKFLHILASIGNIYFSEHGRPKGALRFPGDMEAILEVAAETGDESALGIGVSTIGDLSWKQRLDLDACTSCGRCQEVCPAYNSGKPLSPKWLILDTRDHMLGLYASGNQKVGAGSPPQSVLGAAENFDRGMLSSLLLKSHAARDGYRRAKNELVENAARNIGVAYEHELAVDVMDENVFWSCTSCRACMEVCPVGIEHVDLIMDVRRNLTLLKGEMPGEAQASLRAIETRGNPFGPPEARTSWTEGLNVPILEAGADVDLLYWVGCISAYDRRKQKIARAMVEILNRSGLSWGILGNKERCTGDPARRLGEENLFQTSAKTNLETLSKLSFKRIVAHCPHCFNTLKNEYCQLTGRSFSVVHHSELLQELLANGRITVKSGSEKLITFHDPCYLGRYNDNYDAPREVVYQIGKNSRTGWDGPKEMPSHREKGMCCGAGGGHFWMDLKIGERVNVLRVKEAEEIGANTIATGCPFCMHMLEDGLKLRSREDIEVRDIAELVIENLA